MTEQTSHTPSQDENTGLAYTAYDIELLQRIANSEHGQIIIHRHNKLDTVHGSWLIELGCAIKKHEFINMTNEQIRKALLLRTPLNEAVVVAITEAGRALLDTLAVEAKKYNPAWGPVDLAYHRDTIDQGLEEQILREGAYNAGYTDGLAAVSLTNEEIDAINEAFSKIDAGPVAMAVMARFTDLKRRAEEE